MLTTPLRDVLGIDVPIILAPMGSATSAEFASALSNQGGLGRIGSLNRSTTAIIRDIDVVKGLTNRHYAVNHIPPTLDWEAFRHTLEARPAAISFALGDPGDLVRQAHDVGRSSWYRSRPLPRPSKPPSEAPTSSSRRVVRRAALAAPSAR